MISKTRDWHEQYITETHPDGPSGVPELKNVKWNMELKKKSSQGSYSASEP